MERLTIKRKDKYELEYITDEQVVIDKLAIYEDLEEKIGMPLLEFYNFITHTGNTFYTIEKNIRSEELEIVEVFREYDDGKIAITTDNTFLYEGFSIDEKGEELKYYVMNHTSYKKDMFLTRMEASIKLDKMKLDMMNKITLNSRFELLGTSLIENEINCLFSKEFDDLLKIFITDLQYKNIRVIHHFENNMSHHFKDNMLGMEIFPLYYAVPSIDDIELVESRYKCIKMIYYRWCILKGLNPNQNEGWFKSKKFSQYLDSIKFSTLNYVVTLIEEY